MPVPAAGAIPATFSNMRVATPSAALMPLAVNCGNASRMATKHSAAPVKIINATLRYVTVFHAMWTPGLRVCEDTCTKKPYSSLLNMR
jgi:hypothetical protein